MKPFYTLLAAAQLAAAYNVAPPGPAAPLTPTTCSSWWLVTSGDTCASVEAASGLTAAQFLAVNPVLSASSCSLLTGFAYCLAVGGTGTLSTSVSVPITSTSKTSTTTTTPATTTTSAGNGITTPTPTQAGMTGSCNNFHLVVSGDTCDAITAAAGISLSDFYAWNPAVGTTCASLWLGYEVCIGVIGSTPTTKTTTTTAAGNGITTPTPYQSGMATNCNSFHLVVSGDTCAAVATAAGISLAQFYSWNPSVGSTCSFLDLGYYYCIDVIGVTPTTTAAGNGVTTPTPIQTAMVTNCNKFHLVVSGDQCGTVATAAGITLAQFYSWNPAVGSTCALLFLGYYVCIGIL